MKDLILIGGGGHCRSILDSIKDNEEFNIIGILDSYKKIGEVINGIEIIGRIEDAERLYKKGIKNVFIAIGSVGDTSLREELYNKLKKIGFEFPILKDKSVIQSSNISIGEGTFIGKGVIINTDTYIGKNCIINTGTTIEHDCKIGDFVHLAPQCTLSGGVMIGNRSHIGTSATIIQYKKIGESTIIGAGSVVVSDIGDNRKAYGVPCKEVV